MSSHLPRFVPAKSPVAAWCHSEGPRSERRFPTRHPFQVGKARLFLDPHSCDPSEPLAPREFPRDPPFAGPKNQVPNIFLPPPLGGPKNRGPNFFCPLTFCRWVRARPPGVQKEACLHCTFTPANLLFGGGEEDRPDPWDGGMGLRPPIDIPLIDIPGHLGGGAG